MNETFLPHTRTIDVYSSPNTHYVVGSVGSGLFRVLFFERSETLASLSDVLFADPKLYDLTQLTKLLRTPTRKTTHERRLANREGVDFSSESDSLRGQSSVPVHQFRAHLLLGVVQMLKGHYLVLCTERKRVGYVNGHVVYSVAGVRLLSCSLGENGSFPSAFPQSPGGASSTSVDAAGWGVASWLSRRHAHHHPVNEMEAKYMSLFQLVDLTKGDFFFSYTLDLTNSMQRSCLRERVEDQFCWNDYLTMELREVIMFDDRAGNQRTPIPTAEQRNSLWTTDSWICPLLHGSFQQQVCELFGKTITLTLIARRSRFYAGTRYLKRGINEQGKVANHVEVEQVVEIEGCYLASFFQVRGSIPTFWSQETSISVPKPPIKQYRLDPAYKSTRTHFAELMTRFTGPVWVVNLVRQTPGTREALVGQEFANAVDLLNVGLSEADKIVYHAIDFKALFSKKRISGNGSSSNNNKPGGEAVLHDLGAQVVKQCGVFVTRAEGAATFQTGTARTNCIDNLDRTNAGQLFIGLAALREQLSRAHLDAEHFLSGRLSEVFCEMFDALGDAIAQQYGGSQAHKKGTSTTPHTSELLTSIRRYYSNSFTDRAKQDAINLFLGCFVPRQFHSTVAAAAAMGGEGDVPLHGQQQQALWDLENDFYLHNFHVTSRQSLKVEVDIGTARWWPPPNLPLPAQARFVPPILRSALCDEEDSGFYIKFDQVFADGFFAPQPIAPLRTTTTAKARTPQPVLQLVRGSRHEEEEDDEDFSPMSTPSFVIRDHSPLPVHSRSASMLGVEEFKLDPGKKQAAAAAAVVGGGSEYELDPASLSMFQHVQRVNQDPAQVFFSSSSIDPALTEYMEDLAVNAEDMHAVAKVQGKYATTRVVPPGNEFSGMRREVVVSSLYADHSDAGEISSLYAFQQTDLEILKSNLVQQALFVNLRTILDVVHASHRITVHALQFLKLYLLSCFENGVKLPLVTEHLVVSIMNVLCEESEHQETRGRRCNPATLTLKQKLLEFHREHYKLTMTNPREKLGFTNKAQLLHRRGCGQGL
ncbi:hypothetical protein BASA81_005332 [Batrachochytrium salamandrivorans]|nr:hypothetical protein BASA81_005332 [Batrachochytrium salamandrivorans]